MDSAATERQDCVVVVRWVLTSDPHRARRARGGSCTAEGAGPTVVTHDSVVITNKLARWGGWGWREGHKLENVRVRANH